MRQRLITFPGIFFMLAVVVFASGHAPAQIDPGAYWIYGADLLGFHVVIPQDASPMLQKTAKEFQRLWKISTHRPISLSSVNEGINNVWLGTDAIPDDLYPTDELKQLRAEEFIVQTYTPGQRQSEKGAQKQLVIGGGSDWAVLYGIYAFFSLEMGVSFLEPDLVYTPNMSRGIKEISLRNGPDFTVREIGLLSRFAKGGPEFRYAHRLSPNALTPPGSLEYFTSMPVLSKDEEPGSNDVAYGDVSGAQRLFAEIKGAMDQDGNSAKSSETWCWKDPVRGATTWLLTAMNHLRPVLSASGSQMNDRESSSAAAIIFTANEVARKLQDAFPNETHYVLVLLPPHSFQVPRQLAPHPNVRVMLSTDTCDFACPITSRTSIPNKAFADVIEGWRKLGATVYVYDFLTNINDPQLPFPCLETLPSKILFYAQKQVDGVYFAGLPGDYDAGVDMLSLKLYTVSRLLFNPDMDCESIENAFFKAYYGTASEAVEQYLNVLNSALRGSGIPLTIRDDCSWISDSTLEEAENVIQSVLATNLSDEIRHRVEMLLVGVKRCGEIRKVQ